MRQHIVLLSFSLALPSAALASEPMAPVSAGASATLARDINGFELGMPIAQAARRVQITYTQGELVQSVLNGIEYDFGVCPSGRIYRIQSSQSLGNFIPDEKFIGSLQSRLFRKYGRTDTSSSGNWGWDLIEPVRYSEGEIHPFKTNWFSVMVSGGNGSQITLEMTMLDFRICWEDKAQLNQQPRTEALDDVTF